MRTLWVVAEFSRNYVQPTPHDKAFASAPVAPQAHWGDTVPREFVDLDVPRETTASSAWESSEGTSGCRRTAYVPLRRVPGKYAAFQDRGIDTQQR